MERVRIGIVGCGAIAQVQHLPNLGELQDMFEVTWVCDVSEGATAYAARVFHVPKRSCDYRDLLDAPDVDAVLLCHRDPKTEIAVASLEAGKHAFIEKPVCYSEKEAARIVAAAEASGCVAQAGYMKVYDPAFELAYAETRDWPARFIQINHLHPNNALHLAQFHLARFDDVPDVVAKATGEAREAALRDAIGEAPPEAERAFFTLSGSMIHDLYGLRTIAGQPERVDSTHVWQDGRAMSTTLSYADGSRAVATWIDLPDLWDFRETLEVYGDAKRVILSYPTGFARGILSELAVHEPDGNGRASVRRPAIDWESPFKRELRHFHACITAGETCRTPLHDAADDVALVVRITQAYMRGGPVEVTP